MMLEKLHYINGLSKKQKDAIYVLFEHVADLPHEERERNIQALRIVGQLLDMTRDEFYEQTGGFHLDVDMYEVYEDSYYES